MQVKKQKGRRIKRDDAVAKKECNRKVKKMNPPWNESRVNDFSPIQAVIVDESPKRSNITTIIAQTANLSRRKYPQNCPPIVRVYCP